MRYTDTSTADVSSEFSQNKPPARRRSADPLLALRRSISKRFSHQDTESALKLAQRPSQRIGGTTRLVVAPSPSLSVKNPAKRGSSIHKSKPSDNSGTILRAVPASSSRAPVSLRTSVTIMANHHEPCSPTCMAPACHQPLLRRQSQNKQMSTRKRSSSTAISTTRSILGGKTLPSPTSYAGVIGTYKNGHVQWHNNESNH